MKRYIGLVNDYMLNVLIVESPNMLKARKRMVRILCKHKIPVDCLIIRRITDKEWKSQKVKLLNINGI